MNSRGTPRPRLGPSPRPPRSPPLAHPQVKMLRTGGRHRRGGLNPSLWGPLASLLGPIPVLLDGAPAELYRGWACWEAGDQKVGAGGLRSEASKQGSLACHLWTRKGCWGEWDGFSFPADSERADLG